MLTRFPLDVICNSGGQRGWRRRCDLQLTTPYCALLMLNSFFKVVLRGPSEAENQ